MNLEGFLTSFEMTGVGLSSYLFVAIAFSRRTPGAAGIARPRSQVQRTLMHQRAVTVIQTQVCALRDGGRGDGELLVYHAHATHIACVVNNFDRTRVFCEYATKHSGVLAVLAGAGCATHNLARVRGHHATSIVVADVLATHIDPIKHTTPKYAEPCAGIQRIGVIR